MVSIKNMQKKLILRLLFQISALLPYNHIVTNITEYDPAAAQECIQAAVHNFNNLIKSYYGTEMLATIMHHNPDAAQLFTQPALQNFSTLAKDWKGRKVLRLIVQNSPKAAKTFAPPSAKNFTFLAAWEEGAVILKTIMHYYPETIKTFIQPAAQNFVSLIKSEWGTGIEILDIIIQHRPEDTKAFIQPAAQNIGALGKGPKSRKIFETIMLYDPDAAYIFTQAAAQNIQKINLFTLKTIIDNNPHALEIKEALERLIINKNKAPRSFDTIIKKAIYYHYFSEQKLSANLSQTEQHITANIDALFSYLRGCENWGYRSWQYLNNPDLLAMNMQIIIKERELNNKGYYTFIHGQRWEYHLAEQWYRFLWELRNQQPTDDYVFLHLKPEVDQTELDKEQKIRERLLTYGRCCYDCPEGEELRQRILFINYALFGNITNEDSSSAHYCAKNYNHRSIQISLDNVFNFHEYSLYYATYKQELKELEHEHKSLSEYGNMLLIAIPQDILKDCVYSCRSGGGKQGVYIHEVGETDDINSIMNALRTDAKKVNNSDQVEFSMPMTWDFTLNPNNGIKIFSFNAADQKKLAAFNKKSDALFKKIKQDIEQDQSTAKQKIK